MSIELDDIRRKVAKSKWLYYEERHNKMGVWATISDIDTKVTWPDVEDGDPETMRGRQRAMAFIDVEYEEGLTEACGKPYYNVNTVDGPWPEAQEGTT